MLKVWEYIEFVATYVKLSTNNICIHFVSLSQQGNTSVFVRVRDITFVFV